MKLQTKSAHQTGSLYSVNSSMSFK